MIYIIFLKQITSYPNRDKSRSFNDYLKQKETQ